MNINIYQPVYIHCSFHSHHSPTKILCFSTFYTNFPKGSGWVNKQWRLVATPAVSCPCPSLLMLRHSTSLTCFPVFTGRNREALCVCVSCSVVSNSLWPHGLRPVRLLCPWNSPGKNTGVGCHSLLQELFLTQGSNPRLLWLWHHRWILYCWATREATEWHQGPPSLRHWPSPTLRTLWKESGEVVWLVSGLRVGKLSVTP